MRSLHPNQVLYLHRRIIEVSGGALGVRDAGLVESAVYRCRATFGGADLYPELFEKAAALMVGLIKNHPFVDGNKRTGLEALRLFLLMNGKNLRAAEEEKVEVALAVAKGNLPEEELVRWVEAKMVARS